MFERLGRDYNVERPAFVFVCGTYHVHVRPLSYVYSRIFAVLEKVSVVSVDVKASCVENLRVFELVRMLGLYGKAVFHLRRVCHYCLVAK